MISPESRSELRETRGLGELLRSLLDGITSLFRQEVELAKAELSEKASQAGMGIAALAVGALLAFAGLIVLLQAIVIGLSEEPIGLHPGLASLIVGVVVILVGLLLALKGRRNLRPANLTPERTTRSLRRDAELVQERLQ